ncbi:MAG: FeoA family protein [Aphanizomenon sp.]|jgi:ferrous iron transport protein A
MFTTFTVMGCSLELLKSGEFGIVTFCQSQDETIRKKLISMGIKTGNTITVEQQFPTFIIKYCGLSMTINRQIARAIYVRVIDE